MSTVEYEIRDRVGHVTFNRPDKLNAIDVEMRNEIWSVMHDVKDNPDVWMAVITGNMISANRALELGVVNKVVPHDELESATQEYVDTLMNNAPLAMRAIKEVTVRGLNMRLEDRVRLAGIVNRRLQRTEDAQEGIRAFAEKRTPSFAGR